MRSLCGRGAERRAAYAYAAACAPASRSKIMRTRALALLACATGGGNLGRRSCARTSSTSSSVRLASFAIQSYVAFTVATAIACKHACLWVESPHVLLRN